MVRFMFQLRHSGDFKGSPMDVVGLHIYPNLPVESFRLLPFCSGEEAKHYPSKTPLQLWI